MITLSKQQIAAGWDRLTREEREVRFTEENTDILWSTCEAQKVPEPICHEIATVTAYALLGLISPDTLRSEIGGKITDPTIARIIADEIIGKIIGPITNAEKDSTAMPAMIKSSTPDMSDIRPRIITPESPARPKIQVPSGPMVIHTQTSVAPIPSNIAPPDLSRDSGFQSKVESFFAKKAPTPPPQFARIQSQGSQTSPSMNMPKPTMEVPRVVHYGELKTILGTAPTTPTPSGSKPAPLPFSKIGSVAPSRAPMPTPPAPAPKPAPAPSPMPTMPTKTSLAPLPGVKGVPPPPPKPPISPLPR